MNDATNAKPQRENRPANELVEHPDGTVEISFRGHARRAYLWVILIFFPLPLALVVSLIFNVLEEMSAFFALLFALQGALAVFAVLTMTARIGYHFDAATRLVSYRRTVLRKERRRTFANARNFRHLFVAGMVAGRTRRYLIYQLRAIHADGRLVSLSGFEVGSPEHLNAISRKVAEKLELPFTPAAGDKVSKVLKKLGPPVTYLVNNIAPA